MLFWGWRHSSGSFSSDLLNPHHCTKGEYGPPSMSRLTVSIWVIIINIFWALTLCLFCITNALSLVIRTNVAGSFFEWGNKLREVRQPLNITEPGGWLSGVQTQTFLPPKPIPKGSCAINCRRAVLATPLKSYFKVFTRLFSCYLARPVLGWVVGSSTQETWPLPSRRRRKKNKYTHTKPYSDRSCCVLWWECTKLWESIPRGSDPADQRRLSGSSGDWVNIRGLSGLTWEEGRETGEENPWRRGGHVQGPEAEGKNFSPVVIRRCWPGGSI